jgi:hypothetical protein
MLTLLGDNNKVIVNYRIKCSFLFNKVYQRLQISIRVLDKIRLKKKYKDTKANNLIYKNLWLI